MDKIKPEDFKKYLHPYLPGRFNLKLVYVNTVILSILITAASITGILFQKEVYQSIEISVLFVPNDILNITVSIPLLIVIMILTLRKKLAGLLCYPGVLFYITYVYATYLLGSPFSILFIPYLLVVIISLYTTIGLIFSFDSEKIHQKLSGLVPIRISGVIIFSLACLVIIFQTLSIARTQMNHSETDQFMVAQWIVDLLIASPPAVIVGILMMKRNPIGYSSGLSLLLLLSMLFIGLIPIILIKGILTSDPVNAVDILIIATSSMICIIPLVLFLKGISEAGRKGL